MGLYELISASFLGKLAIKKHFFEVHTPKFVKFFAIFFGGFPNYVTTIERQNVLKLELFLNHYHLNKAIIRPCEASFECRGST